MLRERWVSEGEVRQPTSMGQTSKGALMEVSPCHMPETATDGCTTQSTRPVTYRFSKASSSSPDCGGVASSVESGLKEGMDGWRQEAHSIEDDLEVVVARVK